MAQVTINRPDNPHRPPNFTPEATEFGDSWDTVLKNIHLTHSVFIPAKGQGS